MFHLIVKGERWAQAQDWIPGDRVFEDTGDAIVERFRHSGRRISRQPIAGVDLLSALSSESKPCCPWQMPHNSSIERTATRNLT
jgi:hypothetical protein